MANPTRSDLIGRAATAKKLGVHPRTLDRWRKEKLHLPFYVIGEQVKYAPEDIEILMRHRRVEAHGFPRKAT